MFEDHWKGVIKRFASNKKICNCGCAYATWCPGDSGREPRTCMGCLNTPNGHWFCRYGCSTAQIDAREEIAAQVLKIVRIIDTYRRA
jgi:hypothetical protein